MTTQDHTATLSDAAELIDVLTSNLSADHPLRVKAAEQAKPMVARLYALAAQPQQPAGWRPIETAPKDGTRILLKSPKGRIADGFWGNYGVWSWPYVMVEPTEWTPLPTAHPSQQEDDVRDAARYRWLTEDHADPAVRAARNCLLRRMPVMSYSAASIDIDAAMSDSAGEGGKNG